MPLNFHLEESIENQFDALLVEPPAFESIYNMIPNSNPESISADHLNFFKNVLEATLDACIESNYSVFDAHTVTTCCHGVALLVTSLLQDITIDNAIEIKNKLNNSNGSLEELPGSLMWLCRLHILHTVKVVELKRGAVTDYSKLKKYSSLSIRYFSRSTKSLQKHIANIVAARYQFYLDQLPENATTHGHPLALWGKYISPSYSRKSSNGVAYVSNLFSMRVTLSYLSFNRHYVSLLTDVIDENDIPQYRYVSIFLGDGEGGFQFITSSQSACCLEPLVSESPVFVLGGVAYLKSFDEESLFSDMKAWEKCLPELVLACDIWYPQFPVVSGDPIFDSSPIIPNEPCLQETLDYWSNIKGVQAEDPSLFCLTHIYPASLKEVARELQHEKRILPWSFLASSKQLQPSYSKEPAIESSF